MMTQSKYGSMQRYRRHGGAYDRGSADAYYWRDAEPHYYVGSTYDSERVDQDKMTQEEIDAYMAGYEETVDRKDWGGDQRW